MGSYSGETYNETYTNSASINIIDANIDDVEIGDVFKVYFSGNVTSPVGLVSIFNTDAANTDGYRLILNLQ